MCIYPQSHFIPRILSIARHINSCTVKRRGPITKRLFIHAVMGLIFQLATFGERIRANMQGVHACEMALEPEKQMVKVLQDGVGPVFLILSHIRRCRIGAALSRAAEHQ